MDSLLSFGTSFQSIAIPWQTNDDGISVRWTRAVTITTFLWTINDGLTTGGRSSRDFCQTKEELTISFNDLLSRSSPRSDGCYLPCYKLKVGVLHHRKKPSIDLIH